jgi:cell wall-associated NlpC family hydrolase
MSLRSGRRGPVSTRSSLPVGVERMPDVIYQVTRYGRGFQGPGQTSLDRALGILERKLRRIQGPYAFFGGPEKTFTLGRTLAEVEKRAPELDVRERLIIFGSDTGQHSIAFRKNVREDTESPLITFAKRFVGRSKYRLGATGPPGDCDCSGLTMHAVDAVFHLDPRLVHRADTQMRDGRILKFKDASRLRSGDFVFLNYGRLDEGQADHVEFYVEPGRTLGSRGSTDGVGFYDFDEDDAVCVLTYGRLRKEFTMEGGRG